MHRLVAVVVVAACSKGRPDDCAVVRDKPASAMVELSQRYPNNPVKVAQTIENCVAPSGDECERIEKVVAAIPTLALRTKRRFETPRRQKGQDRQEES